ncbi:MAG: 2-phospho-L-lactate transferase [Anaerolineales bacterium]|jgi:LPPG:FO 2-phospho-L-lactate transferase
MAEKDLALLPSESNVVCLAGGVGGAKLADGLAQILPPDQLTIVVNTGDDFQHLGLTVCPDLDTVMYTLGGVANTQTGWGREGESWISIGEVERLGGPSWFSLGDLDLATHLLRTNLLAEGQNLTAATQFLCRQFDIKAPVLPMSNQPAPTYIITDEGSLPFQEWFVKERWQPAVRSVKFPENVFASSQVTWAMENADLVLIAPSNPFVSIDPILNVYPIREMLMDIPRAVVAVSPIIGGKALKGPAAKMMAEMDMPVTATAVAGYYGQLIDGFVIDVQDKEQAKKFDCVSLVTDTIMNTRDDRARLARETLDLAELIAKELANG